MTDPADSAWKLHAAQVDWTGKVDSKASFALALESGALVATLTLTAPGRPFASISRWYELAPLVIGLSLLLISGLLATLVVVPRLRSSQLKAEYATNFIYFGHLKHWTAESLVDRLAEGELDLAICRQVINMSKIAWRKHRLVQWSIALGGIGILMIVVLGAAIALI